MVQFVVGPFPWQIHGARQLALVPDMIAGWILLPNLWRGLRAGRPLANRQLLVLLIPAVAVAIVLTLSVGNYGTQLRERMQYLVLIVPFVAFGFSQRAAQSAARVEAEESVDELLPA
jgi:hypothetical protein